MQIFKLRAVLICSALLPLMGCATSAQNKNHAVETYYQALRDTDPHRNEVLQPGSEKEQAAIKLYVSFYSTYTEDNIRRFIRDLYAPNIYYRDGLVEKEGVEDLESYLIAGVQTMHEFAFGLQDVAVHDGNYYLRWTTQFSLKHKKKEITNLTGISHLRFDKEGRIIFEQDFWDTGVIYERLPIIGFFIRWLKKRA